MKRMLMVMLILALLLSASHALADYKASDAYNVAKRVITQTLEEEGCSDFRFALLDYNVHREGDLYAVYADVKYVDKAGRRQRDYFAFMFLETKEGYEPYFLSMGTRFMILPEGWGQPSI